MPGRVFFFDQLGLPRLEVHLDIHCEMTGRMLEEIERVLLMSNFDRVLGYVDTNSTLAGELVVAKLCIPVTDNPGLRSFNKRMAEGINRILNESD